MDNSNFLCRCGHMLKVHYGRKQHYGDGVCYFNGMTKKDLMFIGQWDKEASCICWEFKLDNLRYLENLSA